MNPNEKVNQNLRNTFKTTRYAFGFVWREMRGKLYILLKSIMSLVNAIFPLVFAVMPGLIINEVTDMQRINILAIYIGIFTLSPVINQTINMIANKFIRKLNMALNLKFEADFYDHVLRMDYETLEKPDIQILKDRSSQTLTNILVVVDRVSALLSAILSMLAISSIIISLNFFVVVLIICIIYVNSCITKWMNRKQFLLDKEASKHERYEWSLYYMMEQFEYAKELRLFDLKSLLIGMFIKNKTEKDKINLEYSVNQGIMATVLAVTNFLQQLALYVYLVFCVIHRGLAVGSMTIFMTTAGQFANALSQVFNSYLGLARFSLNIQELMDFLNIPLTQHEMGSKTPRFDSDSVIEFRNVTFKYPGSENCALKNLNIVLRGDEKLCIVGANGSGKSTFIKLLTRLYLPTEGEILLNGVNINEFDYVKYQGLFAPVFQDFVQYYFSLGENIVLASEYNLERLQSAGKQAGLTPLLDKLPKGYDTQVSKLVDEEGFAPSGGEDQRIAIARALYHNAPFYLLDEPTAALDPLAEYEIYKQFSEMIQSRAAILITHRLSAVQLADKVALFNNGEVVEYGTHKQLYENKELYTDMFNKQAEFYMQDATNS